MTIVDSSVWIDFFNGVDNVPTRKLKALLNDNSAGIGDSIITETLQGFNHDRDYKTAISLLSMIEYHTLSNRSLAIKSADNYRRLRKKGITIRKTQDIVIATYCIEHQLPLLQNDRDFEHIASELDLILL